MKTREQELAELEAYNLKQKAHLDRKYAVIATMPDLGEYAGPSVHSWNLYGSVGSITFRLQRYSSIAEGKNPDATLVRQLITAYPPVPLVKFKDSCTSFRPEPETYTNNGEYTDIDPVLIEVEPDSSACTTVEWYAMVGANLWKFSVELPLNQPKIGTLRISHNTTDFGRESTTIASCDFLPLNGAQRVRWSTGDYVNKTPNRFTVYWERGKRPFTADADIATLLAE